MRNVVTEASLTTRASQWWAAVPSVTALLVALCSAIYFVEVVVGYDSFSRICLLPYLVISRFQVYRIFTSVLFHASIFHVVFNMFALVPIGSSLEHVMGTVRFFHVILLLTTSSGVIHCGLAYLAARNPVYPYPDLSVECGIGFSGVIFALIVIETNLSGTQSRSIFGFFTVPAKLYPWALLFLFQLLMPSVSLLGHLSGILSGFAYTFGLFEWALCGASAYSRIENADSLGLLVGRPGFIVGGSSVSGTLPSFSTGSFRTGCRGGGQRFRNFWSRLQSVVPRGEPVVDERFPGRGRTLGSVHGGPPMQDNQDVRNSSNGNQDELQARLIDRDVHNSSAAETHPGRTTSPVSRLVGAGISPQPVLGHVIPSQPPIDSPALQSLLAMGFDKTKAVHALAASNGDVSLAVDFLSAEGQ